MPFGAFHTADLSHWHGAEADPNLLALLRALLERPAVGGVSAAPASGRSEGTTAPVEWQAALLAKEPMGRRFLLSIGTRRHELECRFRPNYLLNRFVVSVDGAEVAKGGHQYRDKIGFDFPLGDDWVGHVQLASGATVSTGSLIGQCQLSIGGRVLYRESDAA